MRITRPWTKTAYIVGGAVVLIAFGRLTHGLPDLARIALQIVAFSVYLFVAVRSFRGKFEPVAPPRPWWRLTGRPKAGFWLAGWQLLGVVFALVDPRYTLAERLVYTAQNLLIGGLYLNSSIQLVRRRVTSVETTPRGPIVPRDHQVES